MKAPVRAESGDDDRDAQSQNRNTGLTQYCSFKYPNVICDGFQMFLTFRRAQGVVAHLAFDAARIPSVATGYNAFFENFIQHRLMKRGFLLRGE